MPLSSKQELEAKISTGIDIFELWVKSARKLGLSMELTKSRRIR